MDKNSISAIRLSSQKIVGNKPGTPAEVVRQMGAMQAQDFSMVKWAVGIRMEGSSEAMVSQSIDDGKILRTHVLRPTWHLVTAEDIHWMLELTAPGIKASLRSRHKQLEITSSITIKSNEIIVNTLSGHHHLTREDLVAELERAGFRLDDNRAAHLLILAELDGLIVSGKSIANKPTYALMEDRVPKTNSLARDEALARLAATYFTSHGPATLEDFTWWSGLTVQDARAAVEMLRKDFISETIEDKTYWLTPVSSTHWGVKDSILFLPAYDEFLISYADRRAALTLEDHKKAVSSNGIFWPVILVDGKVAGKWKRAIKKDLVRIETEWFFPPNGYNKKMIEEAATGYGNFMQKRTEVLPYRVE